MRQNARGSGPSIRFSELGDSRTYAREDDMKNMSVAVRKNHTFTKHHDFTTVRDVGGSRGERLR